MSKLKAFAAVLKFINGRNDGADSLREVCDYTTDKAKTKDGVLVATQGCSSEHPVEDMLANKRLHNKTHGKQYEHFVLAPCPNGSDKSPESVLKAVKEIVATVFPEHMAVITVHTDTKVVHAHTVLDAVNAVTGRKFSQSPSDLNKVKQKANNILLKHGFGIITASANEFVDHTDYSKEEGFDFLELDESVFISEEVLDIISSYTNEIALDDSLDFKNWYWSGYDNFDGGNKKMNRTSNYMPSVPITKESFVSTVEGTPSTPTVAQPSTALDIPATTSEVVPATVETVGNSYPNTNVITGPTFRIKGTPESNFAGLNELVEQTMTDAQKHQREAANLAQAMQQYGQQTGFLSNVAVYAGPIFDIDVTGGMYSPFPTEGNNNFY